MSNDRNQPDGGSGAVPPEFEHYLRPGPTVGPIGAGETPKHDRVSEAGLADYADLFRESDAPARPSAGPAPTRPPMSPSPVTTSAAGATRILSSDRPAAAPTPPPPPPPAAPPRRSATPPPPPPPAAPPHRSATPPQPPAQPKKQGRAKRIVIIVLVALLAYFGALLAYFALSVNKVTAMPAGQIADTAGANYLLVGSDGRDQLTAKQRHQLRTGNAEGQRTDTLMVLHVPLIGTPSLVSIPRDSWVPIPGHGANKINAAFAEGGAPLLIQTVENTTGLHIDHYVEVGMDGVAGITDSLGGVTLCPKADYNDKNSHLHVSKGCQTMNGKTALAYVRMRYADPTGDIGRAERQQEYMKSVASKTANPLTWLNPFKMFSVDHSAASSLTVDDGTGVVADMRMGMAMAMISAGLGEQTSVPIESDSYWVGGQQAVKWNTPKALELFRSMGG